MLKIVALMEKKVMQKTLAVSAFGLAAFLSIGGCARNISSNTYDAKTLGSASRTYPCVVVSSRTVMVEEGERLEDNKTGGIMGAIAGGALGSAFGGGRGRIITTAGGALAGAAAGAYAEKSMKSQEAIEYVVELQSGGMQSVVQGTDVVLRNGQAAYLIVDPKGRSRLIAR
ncbi:MAG: glycine zipper 2TM domain-containing protein [Holosporaceae bacterium]|jgi:outer membrane lipoprotein SlyB|nr:glycine zipper 2TM domain-containing protein [Holosporaceae bacterium]